MTKDFEIFDTLLVKYKGKDAVVDIPEGITRVHADSFAMEYCFDGCDFVKRISVPQSLARIDGGTFSGCADLEEITVDSRNPVYYSRGNCVIEKASKKLVVGCKTSVIPSDVKSIGFAAFCGCKYLTDIEIPRAVERIEYSAFCYCQSLTSLAIPRGVTAIADHTFTLCENLTRITIPDTVESIAENAFYDCTALPSILIPCAVTAIGAYAFHHCLRLETVYYGGTQASWDKISVAKGNEALLSATRYYYSETPPAARGNYWRYDTDGITPVNWHNKTP